MRKIREEKRFFYLMTLPAVAAVVYGIYHLSKNNPGNAKGKTPIAQGAAKTPASQAEDYGTDLGAGRELASERGGARGFGSPIGAAAIEKGMCGSLEIPGRGPASAGVKAQQWSKFMAVYHDLKADYLAWIAKRQEEMSPAAIAVLTERMKELRVQRPPTREEPDMAWRGIVAWTTDSMGEPMLRVGDGFMALLEKEPARARFELARAMAQAWSPCELERLKAQALWKPLAGCLGIDTGSCGQGTFSEAGWAVSSALAMQVAQPGCTLPAFADEDAGRCVGTMPLPRPEVAMVSMGEAGL